jgi:hypothetical protein
MLLPHSTPTYNGHEVHHQVLCKSINNHEKAKYKEVIEEYIN